MKTVCCRCNMLIRGEETDTEISHGYCPDCYAKISKEMDDYEKAERMTGGACKNCGVVGRWGSRGLCPECRVLSISPAEKAGRLIR